MKAKWHKNLLGNGFIQACLAVRVFDVVVSGNDDTGFDWHVDAGNGRYDQGSAVKLPKAKAAAEAALDAMIRELAEARGYKLTRKDG